MEALLIQEDTQVQTPFDRHSVLELADAIRAGRYRAHDVVAAAIERCRRRNPHINALVSERYDAALAEVANGPPVGPFAGIPIVVKDLHTDVAGLPSTNGSYLFRDNIATRDSWTVSELRRAGFVIIGKSNTSELGLGTHTEPLIHGPARNPHHPDLTTGGSSGGSAAAVAAGLVPVAHGTDSAGSLRIPASACGLVALKPTQAGGLVLSGAADLAALVTAHGVITRTVDDAEAILSAHVGSPAGWPHHRRDVVDHDPFDRRLRVALMLSSPSGLRAQPAVADVTLAAARDLEAAGHHVEIAHPDLSWRRIVHSHDVLVAASVAARIDRYLEQHGRRLADGDLEENTERIYRFGRALTGGDLSAAVSDRQVSTGDARRFFGRYDVLLTPTLAESVPPRKASWRSEELAHMTRAWNVTGNPAITVPYGGDRGGLPVGVQLVAPHGRDRQLLRVAGELTATACPDVRETSRCPTVPVAAGGAA